MLLGRAERSRERSTVSKRRHRAGRILRGCRPCAAGEEVPVLVLRLQAERWRISPSQVLVPLLLLIDGSAIRARVRLLTAGRLPDG
jgi:hypothetical protein